VRNTRWWAVLAAVAFLGAPWRELVIVGLSVLSYARTDPELRKANRFTFHPILEVAALFAEYGWRIEHALPGAELMGRPTIAGRIEAWFSAVPDCELHITGAHGDDDIRVIEWIFSGTHRNSDHAGGGRLNDLPHRGERVWLAGVSVCQMDGDLIAVERCYFDAATLMAGAGVIA